jgi:hypothetical protein
MGLAEVGKDGDYCVYSWFKYEDFCKSVQSILSLTCDGELEGEASA